MAEPLKDILSNYQTLKDKNLYVVGMFERGVTVYAQQVRALNLAYALIGEDGEKLKSKRVAVVGGGVAGLTFTAALIKKEVDAEITLFEKRDNLIPLQSGSDSRWLHPRIYDWPQVGSEMSSANLPIMNWVAGRASDVAVELSKKWTKIVTENTKIKTSLSVYTDAHYLSVKRLEGKFVVEWIGRPKLDAFIPREKDSSSKAIGSKAEFDLVVLCVGFGLEKDTLPDSSYWRNETLGQPYLGQSRATFLISGSGDGAVVDLLRLRIADFRQDRILSEIFSNQDKQKLISISREYIENSKYDLHKKFDELFKTGHFDNSLNLFKTRLRNDTEVIFRTQNKTISEFFRNDVKISFQNRLLFFLLFKLGGFVYSSLSESTLVQEFHISPNRIIRRHGSEVGQMIFDILKITSHKQRQVEVRNIQGKQKAEPFWEAGYFDKSIQKNSSDAVKANWQQEYLPSITQLLVSGFCSAVAGYLHQELGDLDGGHGLRVTLHRVIYIAKKPYLQQACNYCGSRDQNVETAGRTFSVDTGFMGKAFSTRKLVVANDHTEIRKTLAREYQPAKAGARSVKNSVQSIIAVPFIHMNTVFAVLYIDAYKYQLFSKSCIKTILSMSQSFVEQLSLLANRKLEMISNHPFVISQTSNYLSVGFQDELPYSSDVDVINFDYSDFL